MTTRHTIEKNVLALVLSCLAISPSSFAAIPSDALKAPALGVDTKLEAQSKMPAAHSKALAAHPKTLAALDRPYSERMKALIALGPNGFESLEGIAFDQNGTQEVRWRALSALSNLGQKESLSTLKRALSQKDWFMRVGALQFAEKIDRATAQKWAETLLTDQALLVRSAAVEVLSRASGREVQSKLWTALQEDQNFHKGVSLWIRADIVSALGEKSTAADRSLFFGLLDDRDPKVREKAVAALDTLSDARAPEGPVEQKINYWKMWNKENTQE